MEWEEAEDIKKDIEHIVKTLDLFHVHTSRIFCYRTHGSTSRSYARIWSFPKIFQRALNLQAAYVIEVLSKHFDKLNNDEKKKVLIHELLHIPKNFSGALLPHHVNGRRISILTNQLFKQYKKLSG
ncbi:MAG: metallopeptidase [Patescibacteria group bacterium]|nr:metallopeptidase [Patescibacteria group bacterium]